MFEVIYISPSCKQSKNFIYDLAEKLRQNGISNFEVDIKRLQIKSDKFIVSAVDIWGANLGRYHRFTKYYIDKVSISEYPSIRTRENAISKLKELKCRFRENTKEISEEELIEILTEVSTRE